MKINITRVVAFNLIFSSAVACAVLPKEAVRTPASERSQNLDYSDLKDTFLVAGDPKTFPESPLLVGPDSPFNPENRENKLGLSPSNWGYYPGSGKPMENAKTKVPEIVSHIATESTTGFYVVGAATLARSGNSIYLPMSLDKQINYGGIADLDEYTIFDVGELKHRSISPPQKRFNQFEITTDGLSSGCLESERNNCLQVRDVYKRLHPAISPTGKWGVRMVWALDTKAKTLHDAVIVWDLETGEVQRLIKLPVGFFFATYKSISVKCSSAKRDYLDGACLYNPAGDARSLAPSTPFFVSESEIILPLIYLTNSHHEYSPDSMGFLFQSLDLTKEEQNWVLAAENNKIRFSGKANFLYAQVDRSKPNGTELTDKDIESSFSYSSVGRRFTTPGGRLAFPVFSATTLERSLISLLSDYKGFPDSVPYINPKPLPRDIEGKLGTKVVITGTGDFGYAYFDKRRKFGKLRRYFSTDGNSEVTTPEMYTGDYETLPGFYPSIYQPIFAYKEFPLDQQTWKYGDNISNAIPFPGTELIAVWGDASLPKDHYFAKLSSKSQFYNSSQDLSGENKARINRYEGFDFSSKREDDSVQYWRYATLAVVKFHPKDLMPPTGWEKCQAIPELQLEICNQIQYALKKSGKILSGNFYLKSGEKLVLREIAADTSSRSEGCWYKNCQQSQTRILSADIPGHAGVTLHIVNQALIDCTYRGGGRTCGPTTYSVSGSVRKRKPGINEKEPDEKKYDSYELNIFWGGKVDKYSN